jgi:hypothetical protein
MSIANAVILLGVVFLTKGIDFEVRRTHTVKSLPNFVF